jgi:hypothetical protein
VIATFASAHPHVCRIGDIEWAGNHPLAVDDKSCGARQVEPWLSAILQAEHLSLLPRRHLSLLRGYDKSAFSCGQKGIEPMAPVAPRLAPWASGWRPGGLAPSVWGWCRWA